MKPINVPHEQARVSQLFFSGNAHSPEFLKSISHEMRTPLNVIIGICQFLERDQKTPLSPMHRDAVNRMDRNARALLQSVKRLMDELRDGKEH